MLDLDEHIKATAAIPQALWGRRVMLERNPNSDITRTPITGIFTEGFVETFDNDTGTVANTFQVDLEIETSSVVPLPKQYDVIEVSAAKRYTIQSVQPDAFGMTKLILKERGALT